MKFYLDECLPYAVAEALRMVGYEITDHRREQMTGWADELLIPWLGENGYVWITKDHDAKKVHSDQIRRSLLNVVWIKGADRGTRSNQRMNTKMLHRMLTNRLDDIASKIAEALGPRHFVLSVNGDRVRLERVQEDSIRVGARLRTTRQARRRRR